MYNEAPAALSESRLDNGAKHRVTIRYQDGIRTRGRGTMREIKKGGSLLGFMGRY